MSYVLVNPKIYGQLQELDWPIEIVSEGHGFTEGPALAKDGKIFFTASVSFQIGGTNTKIALYKTTASGQLDY